MPPTQTWPHLRPSQVLRFQGNQEELGVHPPQDPFARQIMEELDPCGCSCPIPHTSPHSWTLSMAISMGKRSGSGTKCGQPRAGIHQGVEILRICPLAFSLPIRAGKWFPRAIPNAWLWILPDFMDSLGLLYCPNPSWIWIRSQKGL